MKRTTINKKGEHRYSNDKHLIYHQTYSHLFRNSSILNDERRAYDFHNSQVLFGISECKAILHEIDGEPDKNGMYLKGDVWYRGRIPDAEEKLKRVVEKFFRWRKDQVRSGFALALPKEMPDHLLEEKLKAEALIDVRYAERTRVQSRLKELNKEYEKEQLKNVLPNGPLGRISKEKNRIISADGQRVSYSKNIPFINEPTSPYHLMPIVYYRSMCTQWLEDVGLTIPQLQKKRKEFFEKAKELAIQEGKDIPTKQLPVTPAKIPEWMKRLGIGKKDWPKKPNYKESLVDIG